MSSIYSKKMRLQWLGAIFLAIVAGYLDGYGLLFLKTYVSFMSGNTTSTGVMSGSGNYLAAFRSALAIIFFVTGSFFGSLLSQSKLRHTHRICFAWIAGMLATVAWLEWNGLRYMELEIALLCVAMGMVNPALTKIGAEPVSLTFITGTLNRMGGHIASAAQRKPLTDSHGDGDSHLRRAGIDASVWAGFIGGAVLAGLAGLLHPSLRAWAFLPPCAVMLVLILFSDRSVPSAEGAVAKKWPVSATS
jgi:uncharacterized membrane protein YoaK (UPF0700 family)